MEEMQEEVTRKFNTSISLNKIVNWSRYTLAMRKDKELLCLTEWRTELYGKGNWYTKVNTTESWITRFSQLQ